MRAAQPAFELTDEAVERASTMTFAGRPLAVHIATDTVTDADLWLHEGGTGIVVLGDLVTLPAPFFETACPARWQAALDAVWATPFRLAVPGHGDPMTRAEFDRYRQAFAAFLGCAHGEGPAAVCADAWTRDVGSLLPDDAGRRQATDYATYYVGFLRKNGGASPDCRVR